MKIYIQTRLNSLMPVYDTDAPSDSSSTDSGIGKIVKSILKPYAVAKQGNYKLYEYGKPYPDESGKWQAIIGLTGAAALLGIGSVIFGLGRMSK